MLKKILFGDGLFSEVLRFLITGGLATLIDMLCMGIVLYAFQPENYPHFYQVLIGGTVDPSTLSTVIGTGVGFLMGLIFNYLCSVFFVFREKGDSQSVRGFLRFALLSAGGLAIHLIGMYVGYSLLHINEWIVKIILTLLVLVYNYVTRKLLVFHQKGEKNA